jgi:isopentenyl-diphosphate delta-isomerase
MGSITPSEFDIITAENVSTIFPDVDDSLARFILPAATYPSAQSDEELRGYDEEQTRLMDELCIVLDNDDRAIGSASKKTCMEKISWA